MTEWEVKKWGKSDGARCEGCDEYTEQTVFFGDMVEKYIIGEAHDICDKQECFNWIWEKELDEVEKWRVHGKDWAEQEKYEQMRDDFEKGLKP